MSTTGVRTVQTSMTTLAIRQPRMERGILTRGQQKLIELADPIGEIAAACGVSRPYVSQWRMGYSVPSAKIQATLATRFGIEPGDWRMLPLTEADEPPPPAQPPAPAAAPPAPPPGRPHVPALAPEDDEPATAAADVPAPLVPARLPRHASAVEHVDAMLDKLSERIGDPRIAAREHNQLLDQWRKLMTMRMQAEARAALVEDATVRNHPKWKRLRALIIDALLPFPDAARAVEAAIAKAIGDAQAAEHGDDNA